MSAAILPPAPGLFSTTTDWPHTSCRRLEMSRAVMSVEPPGVNGTTTRTGFTGQSTPAALATDGAASMAAVAPRKRRRFSMDPPPAAIARWPRVLLVAGECDGGSPPDLCAEGRTP